MVKNEERQYIINTYNRQPELTPLLVKGEGCYAWDEEGKKYLDFVGGLAVNALGHSHPSVVKAASEQLGRLIHTSNLYYTGPQVKLAKSLVQKTAADKVFFCNSGAEANEGAIKLARKYARIHLREDRYEIITALNSFHGRTMGTLTATGQEKVQKGFAPLLPGFRYAHFNDLRSFRSQLSQKTCAVMVEPLQGEGGVHLASGEFLAGLRRMCDEHDLLLIFDEVQCGMGRTGALFAYEHYGVVPDIFTAAKALGGGLPIGAMLCSEEAAKGFSPGDHASTFGGNPVVCAAALAVLEQVGRDDFLQEVLDKGQYLKDEISKLAEKIPSLIKEVRGKGLLLGIELHEDCSRQVQKECQEKGLLINCIGDRVIRLMPPLNVEQEEMDKALAILFDAFKARQAS